MDRKNYKGLFLPGYKPHYNKDDNIIKLLPKTDIKFIDHVVGNQPDLHMEPVAEWWGFELKILKGFWGSFLEVFRPFKGKSLERHAQSPL